jgi:hypothetical protein
MAETYANTFEALTLALTPKVLVDNIFSERPTLKYLRRRMKPVSGKVYQPLVEYDKLTGGFYVRGGPLTNSVSGDIATRAEFSLKYYQMPVLLYAQDVDLQGSLGLVDLMQAYIRNAIKSSTSELNGYVFTGNPSASPAQMDSLNVAVDDTATWGLDPATRSEWKAHIMESTDGVSPSKENIGYMITKIMETCAERPDLVIVDPDYWQSLYAQLDSGIQYTAQAHASNPVVKWGFDTFFIKGVPVVSDSDCQGEAFVSGQGTRANAKGYQAYFLNFRHLELVYNAKRAWKWDPAGWRRPETLDAYMNRWFCWMTLAGDMRRSLGRIYNVDLTQDLADFELGTVVAPS